MENNHFPNNNSEEQAVQTPQPEAPRTAPEPDLTPRYVRQIPPENNEPPRKKKNANGIVLAIVICVVIAILTSGIVIVIAGARLGLFGNTPSGLIPNGSPSAAVSASPAPGATAPVDLGAPTGTVIDPTNPVVSIAENVTPCVVTVNNKTSNKPASVSAQSIGSGVVISKDGYIVTNRHVIEEARVITVVFLNSTEEIEATLVGSDSRTDLALLKIDRTGLKAVEFGKKENIRVGELAVAIGNPLGEAGTVTTGVVSAIDRVVENEGLNVKMLQTDAAINPGNSGGALVNIKGQLIGINTMKTVSTVGPNGQVISAEGMGYAVPIDTVESIVKTLIEHGKVVRAGLGISGGSIREGQLTTDNPAGIYVSSVKRGEAADNAGIRQGDVIHQYNGQQIESFNHMITLLSEKNPGDQITLTVYRRGQGSVELTVTLTEFSFSE